MMMLFWSIFLIILNYQTTGKEATLQIPQVFPLASLMWPASPHWAAQEFLMVHDSSLAATKTTPWSSDWPQLLKTPLPINIKIIFTVELPIIGINSNSYGSTLNSILEVVTVTRGNILERWNTIIPWLSLALVVSCSVCIVFSLGDTVIYDVLEGLIHPTTVTSGISVARRTIN